MDEELFKFILKCQKNYNKPECHSFKIMIDKGTAYVECRKYEVYVEYYADNCKKQWCGQAIAAANLLLKLKADEKTIDM